MFIIRLLISFALVLLGAVFFYVVRRTNSTNLMTTEWRVNRAERKARLEARSILTRAETEELRIIQSIDQHEETIANGYRPNIMSVTSPTIKDKQLARHAEFVKNNPMFKDSPPAPLFLYRSPNVHRVELEARSRAAADVGTAFVFYNTGSNYDSDVQATYIMVRTDTPERWTVLDIIHAPGEDLLSIAQSYCHATTLIHPPKGLIVGRVWKPFSKTWN